MTAGEARRACVFPQVGTGNSCDTPPNLPGADMSMGKFLGMAHGMRRARGTGAGRVPVFVEVAPEAKDRLDTIAGATGATKWAVVQALLEHVELDEHGRPVWWSSTSQQEVLDIPA